MTKIQKHTLLGFMIDSPGVLNKIAMLFRRKMYNIDTLTVCQANEAGVSRMTITLQAENPEKIAHIIKQIKKIPEVIDIKELDPEKSFWRELAIIKCSLMSSKLKHLEDNYQMVILAEDEDETLIQIAGTERSIDGAIGEIGLTNILEIARTGVTSMEGLENSSQ